MIRFGDKIVLTVTHEVPYCVAVAIWLLEGCITQANDGFEEFKEKQSIVKYRVLLNYEAEDLLPTVQNSLDSICYRVVYSLKFKFANVHAMGSTSRDMYGNFYE